MFSKTNHITKFFRIKIHFYPGARKTPPPAIRSVRDLIHWQYAKIIADSAGMGKRNYRFVMSKFKKLQGEEIFWNEIREYVKEREKRRVHLLRRQGSEEAVRALHHKQWA